MKQVKFSATRKQAMKALPIIQGGLKLLQTRGWCQGAEWISADGNFDPKHKDKFCAYGAIVEVAGRSSKALFVAGSMLDSVANEKTNGKDISIIEYNDSHRRTKRQVMKLFSETISQVKQFIKGGN